MTGKDFIKILLCVYGYDKNIQIETTQQFGSTSYDIHAENSENGDTFSDVCDGLVHAICDIIDAMNQDTSDMVYMDGSPCSGPRGTTSMEYSKIPLSSILNDKIRMEYIEERERNNRIRERYIAFKEANYNKEIGEIPCKGCTDKFDEDKVPGHHWDCYGRYAPYKCGKLCAWHKARTEENLRIGTTFQEQDKKEHPEDYKDK